MKRLIFVLLMMVAMSACDKQDASTAQEAEAAGPAEFTMVDGTTEEGINELNANSDKIIEQVVQRHKLDSAKVEVRPGDPPGLGFTVTVEGGKKVKLKVPPSKFPAELVTNFDHTLDRGIRRAAGLDEK